MPPHVERITKAGNTKTRNILRGLVHETSSFKIKNALRKIKLECGESDLRAAISILRSNPLFEHNGVSREFGKTFANDLETVVTFDAQDIASRLQTNEAKLIALLELYIEAQTHIQNEQFDKAHETLDSIIQSGGVSCLLVRTLMYFDNRVTSLGVDSAEKKKIDEIYKSIGLLKSHTLRNSLLDLCNEETDYFNIYRRISSRSSITPTDQIIKFFIKHISFDTREIDRTLSSFYTCSLLDALCYIYIVDRYSSHLTPIRSKLSPAISDTFKRYTNLNVNLEPFYRGNHYYEPSIKFFRECFLIIELLDAYNYRSVHAPLYSPNEAKALTRSPIEKEFISGYFSAISSLRDLDNTISKRVSLNAFNLSESNFLERSTGLVSYIERYDGNINDEDIFVRLMSKTRDISFMCPASYLRKMTANAQSQELLLVLACIACIKESTHEAEHFLRKVIQNIAISQFDSDLLRLLEHLYSISPAVTENLIQICDETFLSKLFFMIDKPNKAIEGRADLLEWYGKLVSEPSYVERAKNLRIDVQISREKGTIDDSRIYVDPVKYTQWIQDHVINDLSILLKFSASKSRISSVSINWKTANGGISTKEQIASLLLRCYEIFCTHHIFGIASYLGRRIRHGTFKGTGLKEIKDFLSDETYSSLFIDREFRDEYNAWVSSYENMLEEIKSKNLHIKTKRSTEGLINPDFNSSVKTAIADRMYIEVHNSFFETQHAIQTPYIITEYCWRIIEEDLNNIRKFLMEKKSKHAVFKTENVRLKRSHSTLLHQFCREVNSVTAEKFRMISMWFSKPSIASPSADLILLFRAVVSEVKGTFEQFNPSLELPQESFNINGGQYHAIYDALYVLICNAAAHGKHKGSLAFHIKNIEGRFIELGVASEIPHYAAIQDTETRIKHKLTVPFENAHVFEGNSGIFKLRQLVLDGYIADVRYEFLGREIHAYFRVPIGIQNETIDSGR